MIYVTIISIIIVVITAICSLFGALSIIRALRNPAIRMDNGGPRFSEVKKVKTQTVFCEIIR